MPVTIKINGVTLTPQPMETTWFSDVIDQRLNGTDATGAYQILRLSTPRFRNSVFNWDTYENQVLTSIQAFAPGDTPNGASVLYNSGVVARKIREYRTDINRTNMCDWEIAVIV
jgi:hypothetical protein